MQKHVFTFRTKFVLFGYFCAGTGKNYCTVIFCISTLKFFQTQNFVQKWKSLNLGPNAVIGLFGLEFQKTNVVFAISIFEFVNMQRFIQNQKTLNLQLKKHYLGFFELQFNKNYYQIFN